MKDYKGLFISKADCCALDSPKKQMDKFDLFAVKSKKSNKTNSSVHFLGESTACQSALRFCLTFNKALTKIVLLRGIRTFSTIYESYYFGNRTK